MFESSFLEFFSRVHWTVPLLLFVPIILIFLMLGSSHYRLEATSMVLLVLTGIFFWTFTEYMLHRFVFHYHAQTNFGKKLFWTFHGVHHDYPSDPLRLVMVPSVSLPLAALFYLLFRLTLGVAYAAPFSAGFLSGYLFYDITHYAVHHFPIKGKVFGRLRELHMRHHFQAPEALFGVSSPVWDYVFNTMLTEKGSTTIKDNTL